MELKQEPVSEKAVLILTPQGVNGLALRLKKGEAEEVIFSGAPSKVLNFYDGFKRGFSGLVDLRINPNVENLGDAGAQEHGSFVAKSMLPVVNKQQAPI